MTTTTKPEALAEIVVRYKSEILGDGEFWRGPPAQIVRIRNIPARETAAEVVKDGITRKCGMWTVSMEPPK